MNTPSPRSLRQQHEAEVYDARASALVETLHDDELVVDRSHPPYPNREHVEFLDFVFGRLGDLAETDSRGWLRQRQPGDLPGVAWGSCSRRRRERGDAGARAAAGRGQRRLRARPVDRFANRRSRRSRWKLRPDHCEPGAASPRPATGDAEHRAASRRSWRRAVRGARPPSARLGAARALPRPVLHAFPARTDTPDERSIDVQALASIRARFRMSDVHPVPTHDPLAELRGPLGWDIRPSRAARRTRFCEGFRAPPGSHVTWYSSAGGPQPNTTHRMAE